ncbi:MAG: PLP-dependent aminotransferase family protein [Rhodospirillaceae bacterium]|nr:PLP-dependent aminotransferase family protein [Rhodospirillaceae bacterium]MBT6677191.1 PLP-dependent aminotransferase family protein [Rhodospirillaceae bacterium]
MSFDYTPLFRNNLPAPAAARWGGFPKYSFIGGNNDAASVPVQPLLDALAKVMQRDGQQLATYGMNSGPQGYRPLREAIAKLLETNAHMPTDPDDMLITTGSNQGIDLVNDAFLSAGDTVIVEEVCYASSLSRLRYLGVNYVLIDVDEDGMNMAQLDQVLADLQSKGSQAKYIYTIPTVQNPSGTIMSVEKRQKMLDLARKYGVPIFEDDCYSDLTWDGTRPPTIRSMDDAGQVIYCATFSKSIAPALRIGYVVADWPVLSQLIPLKTDGGCGALEQMALAEFCNTQFNDHVAELRGTLKAKCDLMLSVLDEQFGTTAEIIPPKGGIFIWITMPEEVDTDKLAKVAAAQGVVINPGSEWSADPVSGRHRFRLCFGNPTHAQIREGVTLLAEICHEEFGVPLRGANVER